MKGKGKYERSAEILECAADLIEKGGLAKGTFWNGARYCTVGAIRKCANGDPYSSGLQSDLALEFFRDAIQSRSRLYDLQSRFRPSISFWNDDPTRTQEEVVAKLREVARSLREREGG